MDELRTVDQVVDAFGGTGEMARIFNVTPSAVSNWRARGLPDSLKLHRKMMVEIQKRGLVLADALFEAAA